MTRTIRRDMVRLALPIVASSLMERTVSITDVFLVGALGAPAISAVGLSQLVIFLVLSLTTGLVMGSTVVIAQLIGAGRTAQARKTAFLSLLCALVLGLALGGLGLWLRKEMGVWMGAETQVARLLSDYLFYVFLFFPFTLLVDLLTAIFHGQKETRVPMKGLILINLLHLLVAYPLIYGKGGLTPMGVSGAAVAIGIAEGIGAVYLCCEMIRRRYAQIAAIEPRLILPVLRLGLPLSLDRLVQQSGQVVYARMVLAYGTAAYAAHQIGLAIEALSFMSGNGFAIAAVASVGQSVGAADLERARLENWEANKAALSVMSIMGLLFFFSPYPFLRAFTPDQAVIALGVRFLKVVAAIQIPLAITMVLSGSLKGAGDIRFLLGVTLVGSWLVRAPAAYFVAYVKQWGISFLWGVMILDWSTRTILVLLRYRSGKWHSSKLMPADRP